MLRLLILCVFYEVFGRPAGSTFIVSDKIGLDHLTYTLQQGLILPRAGVFTLEYRDPQGAESVCLEVRVHFNEINKIKSFNILTFLGISMFYIHL